MRRKDREVTEKEQILDILDTCKVLRMAVSDENGLYIVPLNYGYEQLIKDSNDDLINFVFYIHCAKEGRKLEAIKCNPNVAFEMDCCHELIEGETACYYGYRYKSIIGNGVAEVIATSSEKIHALQLIMKQQTGKEFQFTEDMAEMVAVIKITATELAAKWHK